MFHTKYSVKAYLLTLVTVVTIGSSYAAQDPTVLDYIASLQTNSPNLPNLPNQKGQFGYILSQIFGTNGKIKQDYLDLSGVSGGSSSVTSVNGKTGSVVITQSDVGLSNVENTTLSTWTGTTNITTLGTVTTGVWSGTAISPNKIATDSSNRFITDAERTNWNNSASSSGNYYTKTNSQTAGQAQFHWANVTNVPTATTTTSGVVVLDNSTGSTSTTTAATAWIVKSMWDSISASLDTKISSSGGTSNYIAKYVGGMVVGVSQIFDNGLNVGIGTNSPTEKLEVAGNIRLSGATPMYRMTNIANPIDNNDAANKGYVDSTVLAAGSNGVTSKYLADGSYYSEGGDPYFCKLNTFEGTSQKIISVNQNQLCNTASNLYCNAGSCNADAGILTTIKQTNQLISARDDKTCSIANGQVYCWGYTGNGQKYIDFSLSQGNNGGESHSCTVLSSGQVRCWGQGSYGQLGNGASVSSNVPVVVSGISNAVNVYTASAGYSTNYGRSCALLSDGTVKCWGYLPGYGTINTPLAITGLSTVVDFSLSQGNDQTLGHWCAVLVNGTVKCAGSGLDGQLGNGGSSNASWISGAVTVVGISNAIKVYTFSAGYGASAYGSSCALLSTGKHICWGSNANGQLAIPSRIGTSFTSPYVDAPIIANLATGSISLSPSSGNGVGGHACSITSTGSVLCWGRGNYYQLGNGGNTDSGTPVRVSGITNAVKIYTTSAGYSTNYGRSCALLSDGTMKCWGYLPTYGTPTLPQAMNLSTVVDFSLSQGNDTGIGHWCAVLANGTVKCAGSGLGGQLGNSNTTDSPWLSGGVLVTGIANAVKVYTATPAYQGSATYGRSCALLSDGTVKCWGNLASYGATSAPVAISGLSNVVDFSMSQMNHVGEGHWCAVLSDGTMRCAGTGGYSQLGNGGSTSMNWIANPVTVSGIGNAIKVYTNSSGYSTNYGRSCALLSDGTVKCWGYLYNVGNTPSPTVITGLANVIDFALSEENDSGEGHWCAVISDGTVKCSGSGGYAQLGSGDTTQMNWLTGARTVAGITSAKKVYVSSSGYSTTYGSSCAQLSDGVLRCWGNNTAGKLGIGNVDIGTNIKTPYIDTLNFTSISSTSLDAGSFGHSCGLTASGQVACWGSNSNGELGQGFTNNYIGTPSIVPGISGALKIYVSGNVSSTHYARSCALLSDGTVKCWGHLMGIGATSSPVAISGLSSVVDFSMSSTNDSSQGHWCAVISDGSIKCGGYNATNQLGDGTTTPTNWTSTPVVVSGITNAIKVYTVSSGWGTPYGSSCALLSDGMIKCWGYNGYGILGDATNTQRSTPVAVSSTSGIYYSGVGGVSIDQTIPLLQQGISAATSVAAGAYHACVIDGGLVKCWGYNAEGQLGNSSTNSSALPVGVSGISNASQIASGYMHTCAILTDTTVKCWGLNAQGQLGNGSTMSSTIPVIVTGISGAVEISAGDYHTCVILTDGTSKCWGLNARGQLGNGGYNSSTVPVLVSGISGATRIVSGANHTCTVQSSGSVYCWGVGEFGQIGNGSFRPYSSVPFNVPGITTALRIGAGSSHTCATLSDGSMKCWGLNANAQQASTSYFSTNTPMTLFGVQSILTSVGGGIHTCTITNDLASVSCFGGNYHGQLGVGTLISTASPTVLSYQADTSGNASNYTIALCETRDVYNGNLGGVDGANAICQTQCGLGYKFIREAELANFQLSSITANTYWIDRAQNTTNNCNNWTTASSGTNGAIMGYIGYNSTYGIMNALTTTVAACNTNKQLICARGIR